MTTVSQNVTAEDLLRMPDDGFRYELVKGELRRIPPAGGEHGDIAILRKNDILDGNDFVPGWTLPIADLFV